MKKKFIGALGIAVSLLLFTAACDFGGGSGGDGGDPDPKPKPDPEPTAELAEVYPLELDGVVTADNTEAGSYDAWIAQRMKSGGSSNDDGTPDSMIQSPFHTLVVNGTDVPVYTARCGTGAHSFARIDVDADADEDFRLEVELTMNRNYPVCAVLPLSRGVTAEIDDKKVTSVIEDVGSYTYTFSTKKNADTTDPKQAPLTLIVSREEKLKVPTGYDVVEIEAGTHGDNALAFDQEDTYYVFKKGVHNFLSINIPSNSVVWLERGAYLKAENRRESSSAEKDKDAIHCYNSTDSALRGRGVLDTGSLQGGEGKYRNPIGFSNCDNAEVSGLTVVNSNCWTICFTNCDNGTINNNLLLSYRTFSDGIMMSDCRNSAGRFNFVRTGDDGIEFKGTGWGGNAEGSNCIYEYNDVWTDKGMGYGVIYESACNMTNMIFRNNTVGFAQPTWKGSGGEKGISCALDVYMGTNASTVWSGIKFKNIEIYHVISPSVAAVWTRDNGGTISDILFENITVRSTEFGVRALAIDLRNGSIDDVKLKNFNLCGKTLTAADIDNEAYVKCFGNATKEMFTIE